MSEPRLLEGRVTSHGYTLCGFGGETPLDAQALPVDREGVRAAVRPGSHALGLGLQVRAEVELTPEGTPTAMLELSPMTQAQHRARPLLGRLGGDPGLIALLAPPRWTLCLRFDAEGRLLAPSQGTAPSPH